VLQTRRQNIRFPGGGRGLEAFQLLDNCRECLRPFGFRIGGQSLPAEQETQKIRGWQRLDFSAQALDGVAMDARQQAAFAPLGIKKCALSARRLASLSLRERGWG